MSRPQRTARIADPSIRGCVFLLLAVDCPGRRDQARRVVHLRTSCSVPDDPECPWTREALTERDGWTAYLTGRLIGPVCGRLADERFVGATGSRSAMWRLS